MPTEKISKIPELDEFGHPTDEAIESSRENKKKSYTKEQVKEVLKNKTMLKSFLGKQDYFHPLKSIKENIKEIIKGFGYGQDNGLLDKLVCEIFKELKSDYKIDDDDHESEAELKKENYELIKKCLKEELGLSYWSDERAKDYLTQILESFLKGKNRLSSFIKKAEMEFFPMSESQREALLGMIESSLVALNSLRFGTIEKGTEYEIYLRKILKEIKIERPLPSPLGYKTDEIEEKLKSFRETEKLVDSFISGRKLNEEEIGKIVAWLRDIKDLVR